MKRHAALALWPLSLLVLLLGVAATAALAAETTLCKQAEEQCKNPYPNGEALEGTVVKWELENSIGPVTCGQSTLKAKSLAKSGEPMPIEISAQELAKCNITVGGKVTACGVSNSVNLPYSSTLAWKALSMDGQWRWKSGGAGNPGFKIECAGLLNCTFTATEPIAELFGGPGGSAAVAKVAMARVGGTCPTFANWYAVWAFTKPSPLYVGFV